MKINHNARSIAGLVLLLPLLGGCEALGIPDLTRHDEVPNEIKEIPRVVTVPSTQDIAPWPRLGDVPAKPKDFSPKPVYEQAMDEMIYQREQGAAAKAAADAETPTPGFAIEMPEKTVSGTLAPPQFKNQKDK